MKRGLPLLALSLASVSLTAQAASIEVQGHRGARGQRPENTLPAFSYALEVGVDTLELDLGVTKDNVLVVSHEFIISPDICLGPDGQKIDKQIPIHSLTLAEVKSFDCGTIKNARFPEQTPVPGTRIPTLAEVFELVNKSKLPAAKKVQFNIETKITPRYADMGAMPQPAPFAKLVVDEIRKAGMIDRSIIQSFDHRSLVEVRKLEPKLRLSPLFGDIMPDITLFAKSFKPEIISPNLNWITPDTVKEAHTAGVKVIPWTADTVEEWDWLVKCGVDGIISDDPAKLIQYLKDKKLRS